MRKENFISSNPPHKYKYYISNSERAPNKKHLTIKYNKNKIVKPKIKYNKNNNNLLLYKKNKSPIGQKIIINGTVFNRLGKVCPNIFMEIWQANASGKYRDMNDKHDATIDPNFFGYGSTMTDKKGNYKFITVLPGAYPWDNHKNAWRPKHIHFSLMDYNFFSRLCTQMYFPEDVLLKYDPIFNSVSKKFRDLLIAKFDNELNNIPNFISYKFDIVMP